MLGYEFKANNRFHESKQVLLEKFFKYNREHLKPFDIKTKARIMTFNVEGFKNYGHVMSIIRDSDSDIVGLNEALFFDSLVKDRFLNDARNMGYEYIVMCNTLYGINVLLSKYYINSHKVIKLAKDPVKNRNRYALKVNIDGIKILLTHLDAFDQSGETRLNQIKQILDNINSTYIVMGDLNSISNSNVILELENSFTDSFKLLQINSPLMTSWIGSQIDYIYVGNDFPYQIFNCNVHFAYGSDHIPVYIDL